MATGNLVNLKKTSEMSPIKDEFLASYSKQNLKKTEKKILKKSAFKLSTEGPVLLVFVKPPQIFFKRIVGHCH